MQEVTSPLMVLKSREIVWASLSVTVTVEYGISSGKFVRHTSSTFALPVSFIESGNVDSNPVSGSCRSRNAWCGRFGLPASVAVRIILRLSAASMVTSFERGARSESL